MIERALGLKLKQAINSPTLDNFNEVSNQAAVSPRPRRCSHREHLGSRKNIAALSLNPVGGEGGADFSHLGVWT